MEINQATREDFNLNFEDSWESLYGKRIRGELSYIKLAAPNLSGTVDKLLRIFMALKEVVREKDMTEFVNTLQIREFEEFEKWLIMEHGIDINEFYAIYNINKTLDKLVDISLKRISVLDRKLAEVAKKHNIKIK